MDRIILQVPMSKTLKQQAEVVAKAEGFSSLQEIVRILINKFARKEIRINIQTEGEPILLSPRAAKRYNKIVKDIEQGKGIVKADNVEDFLRKLRS